MRQLPTILDMGSYLFVHGGIPTHDLDRLSGTPRYQWLKNDRFLEQDCRFSRCVVTGHWPVCLYRQDELNMNPLFDYERRIIAMDGGYGLKTTGQLNALVFPDKDAPMEKVTWESYDAFPLVTALENQEKKPFSLYIQYLDSQVDLLEEKDGMTLCRHSGSGKELWIPSCYLYRWEDGWHANDYSDEELEVNAGDELSVLYSHASGCYVKKNGISGWYRGSYRESPSLGISPGSVSVLGLMNDAENRVQLLMDRDVLKGTYFGCWS